MAQFDIDRMEDTVFILVKPGTDEKQGHIKAYYSKGGICYAEVVLYCGNLLTGEYFRGIGKAGGYGYDKFSAAVSDALHNGGMKYTHKDISAFVFGNGRAFGTGCQKIKADSIQAIKDKKIIPVYSGAGNVQNAFSLYWTVLGI